MAERANETVEIEAAHMPMLTRPTELATLIARIAEGRGATSQDNVHDVGLAR